MRDQCSQGCQRTRNRSHGHISTSSTQLGTHAAGLCWTPVAIALPVLLFWPGAAGWHHAGEGTALSPTLTLGSQLACRCLLRCSLVGTLCHVLFGNARTVPRETAEQIRMKSNAAPHHAQAPLQRAPGHIAARPGTCPAPEEQCRQGPGERLMCL